jgi:hypothetical protein
MADELPEIGVDIWVAHAFEKKFAQGIASEFNSDKSVLSLLCYGLLAPPRPAGGKGRA